MKDLMIVAFSFIFAINVACVTISGMENMTPEEKAEMEARNKQWYDDYFSIKLINNIKKTINHLYWKLTEEE